MDSLTHIVAGACIGELIAGKKIGKKAMLLGAIANSLPDIDVLSSLWLSMTKDLLAHRGFTHSLLFAALVSPLLAFVMGKVFKRQQLTFGLWTFFWCLQICVHLFIDSCTAYGTGLFEPFSHYRVSFNAIFVADPLFSIWLIAGAICLLVMKMSNSKRRVVAKSALWLSGLYLCLCVIFKMNIDNAVAKDMKVRNVAVQRYFTTPTPLNNLLWYIICQNDSGYYIGYRSVFDHKDVIDYHYNKQNNQLLKGFERDGDVERLLRFSKGYYTIDQWHDTLVFNDLRFGEIAGWSDPQPKFVFYYYLQHPAANDMIVQRGRFAKWDKQQLLSFWNRIKGN